MASVRKREWTASGGETKTAWVVSYTDQTGKRRLKTFPLKKVADSYRLKVETELERGVHVAPRKSITLSDALDNWLRQCDRRAKAEDGMRSRTVRHATSLVNCHIRPRWGATLLTEITARGVQAWLDELAYEQGFSHAHLKHLVSAFRRTLKCAAMGGYIGTNIFSDADIRVPGKRSERREIPTKDEIRNLLAWSGEVLGMGGVARYLRPMIYTAVFTGMRQGELRALKWSDIDFEAAVIHVRASADNLGEVNETKTRAGMRDIPLSPLVAVELKKWKLASGARSPVGLVFIGNRGAMVQMGCIQQAWARLQRRVLADAAKLPTKEYFPKAKYPFHSLRHVAASLFIESGLPPKRIQTIMGHSSISMTFDRYGHLFEDPDLVSAAMEKIGKDLVG